MQESILLLCFLPDPALWPSVLWNPGSHRVPAVLPLAADVLPSVPDAPLFSGPHLPSRTDKLFRFLFLQKTPEIFP